jgi:drug/metabolite transporter (DMT)-like permease
MNSGKIRLSILFLILINVIWGASFPIYKWTLETVPSVSFVFLRFFIGALILLPFAFRDLTLNRKDIPRIFIASFLGITVSLLFLMFGLDLSDSINAPIILSTGPIILLIGSFIFLKEKLRLKKVAGTLVSLTGVLLIVLMPLLEKGMDGNVLGNIYFVIAAVGGVTHVLVLKSVLPKYRAISITFWTFIFASIPLVPLYINELSTGWINQVNYPVLLGIIYGALVASAICYAFYMFAIKYVKAGDVGIFSYVDPIATIVIAVPLLGEQITIPYLIGSFLVFLGIFIAEGKIQYHPINKLFKSAD